MYFLWLEGLAESVMGTIVVALRTLCFNLSSFFYELMINLYDIFDLLCTSRLLENDVLSMISSRIGLILGIVMFFNIAFSFVKMLIDPDAITNKETGAIPLIKKVLIVLVMFGSFNFVFDLLYGMQKIVVENHIISNFILPYQLEDEDLDSFGTTLAYQLMFSFYSNNDFSDVIDDLSIEDRNNITACSSLTSAFKNQVISEGKFDLGHSCLEEYVTVTDYYDNESNDVFIINYNYIFSLVAAIFVDYILLMYCFKIGMRMMQLMVLEILAPVAILSYVAPKKETMFNKWLKIYFATYLDVFIRIGIINFVVFLMATIFQVEKNMDFGFWGSIGEVGTGTKAVIEVIMILALLTFAKKAPDLIKELFPAGASKLGLGLGLKEIVGVEKGFKIGSGILGGAAGGAAMGAIGILSGRAFGGVAGALKGGLSGLKGQGFGKTMSAAWKDQSKLNKTVADVRRNGGSAMGYYMNQMQQRLYMPTAADRYNKEKSDLETENAAYKAYDSYIDAAEKRAEGQILKGEFNTNDNAKVALKYKNLAELYRNQSANIKRSDYSDDASYDEALTKLAKNASDAESKYLKSMKAAKKDFISDVLAGKVSDDPTLQNMQQAAGIIEANSNNSDYNFIYAEKDDNGNVIGPARRVTKEELLAGDYNMFDNVNNNAKSRQTENNNKLAKNQTEGVKARANSGK